MLKPHVEQPASLPGSTPVVEQNRAAKAMKHDLRALVRAENVEFKFQEGGVQKHETFVLWTNEPPPGAQVDQQFFTPTLRLLLRGDGTLLFFRETYSPSGDVLTTKLSPWLTTFRMCELVNAGLNMADVTARLKVIVADRAPEAASPL